MSNATANDLIAAALMYSRRGWRVLPLHNLVAGNACSCGNPECRRDGKDEKNIAKHPRLNRWQIDATTNEATISAWWERWPLANVGIATGPGLVLDVDVHSDKPGFASLAKLESELGPLPPTLTARTGSGGEHRYFCAPGFHVANSTAWRSACGIDWRAGGGQVVAPPSVALAGPYRWINGPTEPTALPVRWIDAHREYERARQSKRIITVKSNAAKTTVQTATDDELREDMRVLDAAKRRSKKIIRLWDGQWEALGYPSQSEADAALCQLLAFWTNADAARIDRMFRRSKLMRDKWNRTDYGERTVNLAVARERKRRTAQAVR